jgi:hypothetical protein
MRPVLEHINQRRVPGDRVYVFYGANFAVGYYGPRTGIEPDRVISGRCRMAEPRAYLEEVDALRGASRAWLVATHAVLPDELELIRGYLDRIGERLETIVVRGPVGGPIEDAHAYLYDLSHAGRLASSSADTYGPVPRPVSGPWVCYGVFSQPAH